MATKHWIRDLFFTQPSSGYQGNQSRSWAALFHFLRNAGAPWLWECDGDRGPGNQDPNHILDGDMEDLGVLSWTVVAGGSVQKDDGTVRSGGQSLEITAAGLGDGVQSAALVDMYAPVTDSAGTGESISAAVNGIQTYSGNSVFSSQMIGATFTLAGGQVNGNRGSFAIMLANGTTCRIYNPHGQSDTYITPNPPTTLGNTASITVNYKYEIAVWAYNNSGSPWDVKVDPGTGSFVTVGSIPDNGGTWTLYHFQFHVTGAGSVYVQILGTAAGTIYVDGINCYRSAFERLASDHYNYYGTTGTGDGVTDAITFAAGTCTLTDNQVGGAFSPNMVGEYVTIRNAANPGNNGTFVVASYVDPANITYQNAAGVTESPWSGTWYVGGASNVRGTDGVLSNPDLFSTGGSYYCGAKDIGKHLFIWDPANPGNSGVYEIIADNGGGQVQVDMRSPTAVFTANTGLAWRIYDLGEGDADGGPYPNALMPVWQYSAGFGIESIDATKWRFFCRFDLRAGQTYKEVGLWSAPVDTDFRFSDGHFYKDGPSVMRSRATKYDYLSQVGMHASGGEYLSANADTRLFVITDENLSFFAFFNYGVNGGKHAATIVGYLGTDAQHPGIMAFKHYSAFGYFSSVGVNYDELDMTNDGSSYFHYMSPNGTGFNSRGEAVRACMGVLGFGDSTASEEDVQRQSNAKANPYSGDEWLMRPILALDPEGDEASGGEMDGAFGVYHGRRNLGDLTTFDSDLYLHIADGWVIDWQGEQIP